ncbi:hypothetical protein ZIOFF_040486 [Zingiber officinale]|uniref:Uncharacterized protein n=1 Tax=Zingiber officinale TaxID=94328 RepID=A0A8J5GFN6_ZINOF|nr:hypothetical protein ZIOFF_040486 [Zingiber officinale]
MKDSIFSSKGLALASISVVGGCGGGCAGTGFLIHRNLLLTTHACLPSTAVAEETEIQLFRGCTVGRLVPQRSVASCFITDFPHLFRDSPASHYLHRVGRTARAGREGHAVTFLTDDDRSLLKAIVCLLSCLVPHATCRMLFELLVLTGAQMGMDWTTILKKRNEFRVAFVEFDAESVSKFTEKQMVSISVELKLDLGRVRGISLSILKHN